KQHVVRYQTTQRPDLGREEVGSYQHIQMRPDTLLPRGRRLPLWSRRDAMALEDIAHRLVTDRQAQVGQGADNPVIAPGAILLGHTHDQSLDLMVDHGAAGGLALWGAVTFLRNEFAVPGQD